MGKLCISAWFNIFMESWPFPYKGQSTHSWQFCHLGKTPLFWLLISSYKPKFRCDIWWTVRIGYPNWLSFVSTFNKFPCRIDNLLFSKIINIVSRLHFCLKVSDLLAYHMKQMYISACTDNVTLLIVMHMWCVC